MPEYCICGCGKPSNPGSQYHGEDERERSRHRAKKQARSTAATRERDRRREEQAGILAAAGLGDLSLESLRATADGHFALTAALVGAALDRAGRCDESSYRDRLAADTAGLVERVAQQQAQLVSLEGDMARLCARLRDAEQRADLADRDAARLNRLVGKLQR